MIKLTKKKADNFVNLAEAGNMRFSNGALVGVEKFLDKDYWLSYNEDTLDFYYTFDRFTSATADYLLVNFDTHRPEIFDFMVANESYLVGKFPPIKTDGATYAHIAIVLNFFLAQVLLRMLSKNDDVRVNEKLVPKAFQSLWDSYETDKYASSDFKDRWPAYAMLLKLAYGKYAEIIKDYDENFKFDLAKYEDSRRTMIKECYMLAKIATDDYDSDMLFGARTYISLLKYQYYLGRVNEDLSAEIDLIPLLIMVYLYQAIVDKSPGEPFQIFAAMQPRKVLDELISMQNE